MNRQIIAGGLIGLGVVIAMLVGVALGLGIPMGSLNGKSGNIIGQPTSSKALLNKTTAQAPSTKTPATQTSSPNTQNNQTSGDSGTDNNSAPVPALW